MASPIPLGPLSQPAEEDGAVLDYMELPSGMATYHMPVLPEPEEASGLDAALARLDAVLAGLKAHRAGDAPVAVDLGALDAKNRAFVDQVLGEGEVAIIAGDRLQAQESVLAGVWRLHLVTDDGALARDFVEVGDFPAAVARVAVESGRDGVLRPDGAPATGLLAAPSLLAELQAALRERQPESVHAINLSLLPHSEEDLAFLGSHLGAGAVTVLSRGYGNCRISSTGTRHVWWVQYFNSQDALILNSLQVSGVPDVARAAPEDIADSAVRLAEILEVYR